jgi:hypothetical protein
MDAAASSERDELGLGHLVDGDADDIQELDLEHRRPFAMRACATNSWPSREVPARDRLPAIGKRSRVGSFSAWSRMVWIWLRILSRKCNGSQKMRQRTRTREGTDQLQRFPKGVSNSGRDGR